MPPTTAARAAMHWILGARLAPLMLIVTGGEPTTWSYAALDHVFRAARAASAIAQKPLRIGLQTNGTTIGRRFVAMCKRWDIEPSVSLDGPPHLSDQRRGQATRTLRGLARLQSAGVPFGVVTCLTREIAREMPAVLDWFRERHITKVRINVLGAAPPGRADEELTADEIFAARRAIVEHLDRHGTTAVQERNVLRQIARFRAERRGEPVHKDHCERLRCGAGEETAALNPDGTVALCIEKSMTDGLPRAPGLVALPGVASDYWRDHTPWRNCIGCRAASVCDHGCAAYHGNDHHRFQAECEANQRFTDFLQQRSVP